MFQGFDHTKHSGGYFFLRTTPKLTMLSKHTWNNSVVRISLIFQIIILKYFRKKKRDWGFQSYFVLDFFMIFLSFYLLWQTYFSPNCLNFIFVLFYGEGSAKTHISIDICMRVNIKIPATIISDASSCFFPPHYPSRDKMQRDLLARVPSLGSTCLTWAFVHKLFILTNSTYSK